MSGNFKIVNGTKQLGRNRSQNPDTSWAKQGTPGHARATGRGWAGRGGTEARRTMRLGHDLSFSTSRAL